MKKTYTELEIEVIKFDSEDVIATSDGFTKGANPGEIGGECDVDFTKP